MRSLRTCIAAISMTRRQSLLILGVAWFLMFTASLALADISAEKGPLNVYLFASSTCSGCKAIKQKLLPQIRTRFGDTVHVEHVPVDDVEQFKLQLLFEKHYGVTDNEALKVFLGETSLSGEKDIWAKLEQSVEEELTKNSRTPTPDEIKGQAAQATASSEVQNGSSMANKLVLERFGSFKPAAIAIAGLVDGVNPCAFTTLIFFISVLTALKKRKREIMLVGFCFALAVFATYLALGLGALKAVKVISVNSGVSNILTISVAFFAIILGAYSFYDFAKYRRSKSPGDLSLKLPEKLRTRVRKIMSRQMRLRNLVIGALSLGVVVSLLESLCTGQVYLPTIMCVSRDPELACKAMGCLVLYNAMFIVPLLVVFALAYYGVTSERMASFSKKHVGTAKLLLAFLFIGLGIVLLATMV